MATQHPDNASAPYWETDGDGFVSVQEELQEMFLCFDELGVDEFMWDFEGKYADEAVIDKFFSKHYEYCQKHVIGKEKFLTFRIPNVDHEKAYTLPRALMVILTSEDFARDLGFHSPPLFEVILPMTEKAEQLMYVQKSFHKLAQFKSKTFSHASKNNDYLNIIPLVESVESQMQVYTLLKKYKQLHKNYFKKDPEYIRPFIAGSDPALISGHIASVLSHTVALSEIARFTKDTNIPTFPLMGVGSLHFRGGLSPETVDAFVEQYAGIRTVTIQSGFRYDYPLADVKAALKRLEKIIPQHHTKVLSSTENATLQKIIQKGVKIYRETLKQILPDMEELFTSVPKRRERKQHIGFLAYKRSVESLQLPRAIQFTGAFYSVGIPPELIGAGRLLASLNEIETKILFSHYKNLKKDFEAIGRFLNRENLSLFARYNPGWNMIEEDVKNLETHLQIDLGPKNREEYLHRNSTSNIYLLRKQKEKVTSLIVDTGKLRKSLG